MAHEKPKTQTRRRFLTVTGGTLVGMTAVGAARQMSDQQPTETFQFGARVEGWQGRAPNAIDGTQNPTLRLRTGQVYQVTWTNLDGQSHSFALRNSDGKNLKVIYPNVVVNTSDGGNAGGSAGGTSTGGNAQPPSDAISQTKRVGEKGASQTLRFVATHDIERYTCTVHPTTMHGRVETSGERGSGGNGEHGGKSGDHGGKSGDHSGTNTDHHGGSGDHGGMNTDHSDGNGE